MRSGTVFMLLLMAALSSGPAAAASATRNQALGELEAPLAMARFAAVERLAEVGTDQDIDRLIKRLSDFDSSVRISANHAIWQIWSRSGDKAIDELLASGIAQVDAGELTKALATFAEVVHRRPAFAEGWNKRATVLYLLGEDDKSLADCAEVFKRNPRHYGALAGAGQIHLRQNRLGPALDFFRRAVAINPNLDGPAQMIPVLEKRLEKSST